MIGLASMIRSPSSLSIDPEHAVGGRVLGPEAELHLLHVEQGRTATSWRGHVPDPSSAVTGPPPGG